MGSLRKKLRGEYLPSDKKAFNPIDIGRIFFSKKDEKVYGLVVEALVQTDTVYRLSEMAEKFGVVIKYIQYSMPKSGETVGKAIAFIDLTNSKVTAKEALELVKQQTYVKNAEIIEPIKNGIVSDTYFFPLVIADERVVVFRRRAYEALFNGVRTHFGSAGEAFLYYQGFNVGLKIYDDYVEMAETKRTEDLIKIARAVNMTLGWGITELEELDEKKGKAKVRIYESFECELGKNSETPYSHFYRGAIAGLLTRFFRKEVKVKETMCIAKGDPYCEFSVET
jgi:predicted hydrocarbon binding protein